jgi:hypothetical protein
LEQEVLPRLKAVPLFFLTLPPLEEVSVELHQQQVGLVVLVEVLRKVLPVVQVLLDRVQMVVVVVVLVAVVVVLKMQVAAHPP